MRTSLSQHFVACWRMARAGFPFGRYPRAFSSSFRWRSSWCYMCESGCGFALVQSTHKPWVSDGSRLAPAVIEYWLNHRGEHPTASFRAPVVVSFVGLKIVKRKSSHSICKMCVGRLTFSTEVAFVRQPQLAQSVPLPGRVGIHF